MICCTAVQCTAQYIVEWESGEDARTARLIYYFDYINAGWCISARHRIIGHSRVPERGRGTVICRNYRVDKDIDDGHWQAQQSSQAILVKVYQSSWLVYKC